MKKISKRGSEASPLARTRPPNSHASAGVRIAAAARKGDHEEGMGASGPHPLFETIPSPCHIDSVLSVAGRQGEGKGWGYATTAAIST